jgi:RNA polymerase sigma-70 factor (ECF subfamily)
MDTTRLTLIHKISSGEPDAWEELDQLYRPLILNWLRKYQLQSSDAEDLTQEVMTVLAAQVGEFEHNGRVGAFRNWLRTTTVNLARNYLRRRNIAAGTGSSGIHEMLGQLEDPNSPVSREFNLNHDRNVVRRLMDLISNQFEPITLSIFQKYVVEGQTARETATEFEVSIASVHTAKSRVLRRLRKYAENLIDDSYFS